MVQGDAAMIRRYGDAPKRGHRYKVRHGAYAVLPLNGQVLCTWQGGIENEHGKTRDEVQLPGGGIDPAIS